MSRGMVGFGVNRLEKSQQGVPKEEGELRQQAVVIRGVRNEASQPEGAREAKRHATVGLRNGRRDTGGGPGRGVAGIWQRCRSSHPSYMSCWHPCSQVPFLPPPNPLVQADHTWSLWRNFKVSPKQVSIPAFPCMLRGTSPPLPFCASCCCFSYWMGGLSPGVNPERVQWHGSTGAAGASGGKESPFLFTLRHVPSPLLSLFLTCPGTFPGVGKLLLPSPPGLHRGWV